MFCEDILNNVVAYAEPDGGSTKGMQARIDELAAVGGGVVVPKPGDYVRGANDQIQLKSNVTVDGLSIG